MADYECPDCGGGFPMADAGDGCPWCGEAMNAQSDRGGGQHPFINPDPLPGAGVSVDPDEITGQHFQRDDMPPTPHWDSGVRVEQESWSDGAGGER